MNNLINQALKETSLTDSKKNKFGSSIASYEIKPVNNVTNLTTMAGYLVHVHQTIRIPPKMKSTLGPNETTSYENYIAMVSNSMEINRANLPNSAVITLLKMSPKTINASVNTSQNHSTSSSDGYSNQFTSGSSHSNVNGYGVGGHIGIGKTALGAGAFLGIGGQYHHSSANSSMQSQSTGASGSVGSSTGTDTSTSIKDWSAVGTVDSSVTSPSWVWAQSYPWDVLKFSYSNDGKNVNLPQSVQDQMMSDNIVLPPSELSQYGVDLLVECLWLISLPEGADKDASVEIKHKTTEYTASHSGDGQGVVASLQSSAEASSSEYSSGQLNLSQYALGAIDPEHTLAGVNLRNEKFVYKPKTQSDGFKIISLQNNLQVTGTGFDQTLTSNFSKPTSYVVHFKITDLTTEYILYLMHWIAAGSSPCELSIKINANSINSIYVDAVEGESAQNNVSAIKLRDLDYSSMNFHNYLQLGMNTVEVTLKPTDSNNQKNAYTLFSVAVD